MATEAKRPGGKTTTSARKTICRYILHSDVAPTTVQQLSGHKTLQVSTHMAKSRLLFFIHEAIVT
jgi:hypothetical protein